MELRRAVSVLAIALTGLAAGCGDDDAAQSDSVPQGSLSKADFLRQARGVCLRSRDEILKRLSTYQEENGPLDPSDIGEDAVGVVLLPVLEQQLVDLRDLGAPRDDRKDVEAYLQAKQWALTAIETRGLSSNDDLFQILAPSDRLAGAAGLGACEFG